LNPLSNHTVERGARKGSARPSLSTSADSMLPPKLGLRTKLCLVAAFAAIGLVWIYLGSPAQRFRMSEGDSCRDKCTKIQKSWRLVAEQPKGMVSQGKYDGPWSCECY
jgi:hypothetical protein